MKKVFYLLVIVLLMSGCATPSIYIQSDIDSDYKLSKQTDKIFVLVDKRDDVRTREFRKLLIKKLREANFNITDDILEAKFMLCYSLDQKSSQINSVLPISTPSYTTGTISTNKGDYGTYSQTTTATQYIPYSYSYTVKKVYLSLYKAWEMEKTIWEGYLGAEGGTFQKYADDCVSKLLSYYGQNFDGYVNIKINKSKK